jgi:hypothetical protein
MAFDAQTQTSWKNPAIIDALEAHAKKGYSASIIARKLNKKFRSSFTRNAVVGKLHRLGISKGSPDYILPPKKRKPKLKPVASDKPRNGHPWTPEQDELLTRMWRSAASIVGIQDELNRTYALTLTWNQVSARRVKLGLPSRKRGYQLSHAKTSTEPPKPVHIETGGIPYDKWNGSGCRWIIDDGTVCGKDRIGRSYCSGHTARAYTKKMATEAAMKNPTTKKDSSHV